ncbi:hypothetical protein [Robertkochia flava]|uniref:hypothetical protein n=1 Tax=Robertkochia flava TaxID=3447986 RepID=UPI001CCEE354|nr:hypothetical protein [Robertkochia marina]
MYGSLKGWPIFKEILPILLLGVFFVACKEQNIREKQAGKTEKQGIAEILVENREGEAEYVTRHMEFTGPDTLNSGWNHLKYVNLSSEPHFIVLEKLPDSIGMERYLEEVIPVFQQAGDLIFKGKRDSGLTVLMNLPSWFYKVRYCGGVGLTSAGEVGRSTVYLEPGTYVMECYLKMPDGSFHSSMGMVKQIRVSETEGPGRPPLKALPVVISRQKGIEFDRRLKAGVHNFSVYFRDQSVHGHLLGHDVHLAKVERADALESVLAWMDWSRTGGLQSPAPIGINFLGGIQELPMGKTGYFHANLTPGNYILIAEVPEPDTKRMVVSFQVDPVGEPAE